MGLLDRAIAERTRMLALFASPTTGASLAGVCKLFPYLGAHPHIAALQKNSGELVQLNDAWEAWCKKNPEIPIYKFYGTQDKVVPEADATAGPGESISVTYADHRSIVKPESPNEFVVEQLTQRIKKVLK